MGKKKRIAIFASGWASQILNQFLTGLGKTLKGTQTDLFLFLCYPSWTTTRKERNGEFNIFRLPQLEDFDGAIIISNALEFNDQVELIVNRCRKSGTPTISIGMKFDGLFYVGVDNASGMRSLCRHLIQKHNVTHPFFLAGSEGNPDSVSRLNVLKEVMEDLGLSFDDSQVYYTNWENSKAVSFVHELCQSGKPLPDALICANDGIAMNACLEFSRNGYSVPDDIIVTGFDNLLEAQVFTPSISSVTQNYILLGRECARLLSSAMSGMSVPDEIVIPSNFTVSESCCPSETRNADALRKKVCRNYYVEKSADTPVEHKLNYIERMVMKGRTYADIRKNLVPTLTYEFNYDNDTFHLLLEPGYEASITNPDVEMMREGYSKNMLVAVSCQNGHVSRKKMIASRDLIPDNKDDGREHLYIFLPLHEEDNTYGYFVMSDCQERLDTHYFIKFQQRLNVTLERYRQKLSLDALNTQLTEITRVDALTHVKNRMSYQLESKELSDAIKDNKKPSFAIVMFDVNNLKIINDEYGHKAGDEYIIQSSHIICHTFKHSPVFRIGGDEFLTILRGEDYRNRLELIEVFSKKMNELKEADIPEYERISIACGMSEYQKETDSDVEDVFRRADKAMYKNKAEMKRNAKKIQTGAPV